MSNGNYRRRADGRLDRLGRRGGGVAHSGVTLDRWSLRGASRTPSGNCHAGCCFSPRFSISILSEMEISTGCGGGGVSERAGDRGSAGGVFSGDTSNSSRIWGARLRGLRPKLNSPSNSSDEPSLSELNTCNRCPKSASMKLAASVSSSLILCFDGRYFPQPRQYPPWYESAPHSGHASPKSVPPCFIADNQCSLRLPPMIVADQATTAGRCFLGLVFLAQKHSIRKPGLPRAPAAFGNYPARTGRTPQRPVAPGLPQQGRGKRLRNGDEYPQGPLDARGVMVTASRPPSAVAALRACCV